MSLVMDPEDESDLAKDLKHFSTNHGPRPWGNVTKAAKDAERHRQAS